MPSLLGLSTSFGFGDRLGLAAPGHIAALTGRRIVPILAQQSARELTRTGRTAQAVLAAVGAYAPSWGADADHCKTEQDIDHFAAAGFTYYTFDVCDMLTPAAMADKAARLYRHLAAKRIPFEVEIAADETGAPTNHADHARLVEELHRRGVTFLALAPCFVGAFEKGVEYRGDLKALRADFAGHAAIARRLGPYKLSLHSGSDKFSVYPLLADETRGLFHVKTSGTSYLEALRVMATVAPDLWAHIVATAQVAFAAERASYAILAELSDWPSRGDVLDHPAARQILHVTFGSVLARHGDDLRVGLDTYREDYQAALARHFARHLDLLGV